MPHYRLLFEDIARFKKENDSFYIILLDPIPTCLVCNFQSVSSANWQLESFITMTHQLLLSKNCQLTICPAVLSLQLIVSMSHCIHFVTTITCNSY